MVRPRCGSREGFSMTELVMVLAGAMIVLGIAVPVVNTTMDSYRLTLAAQGVMAQMQFARMKSVSSNESFRVSFPGENQYRVETNAGDVIAGPFTLPTNITWNSVDSGGGVTFPGRYVAFTPTGNVVASGNGSAGRAKLISRQMVRVDVVVGTGGVIRQTIPYHDGTAPF
jgi:Tfp pilus assembly protein FimT